MVARVLLSSFYGVLAGCLGISLQFLGCSGWLVASKLLCGCLSVLGSCQGVARVFWDVVSVLPSSFYGYLSCCLSVNLQVLVN